MDGTLWEAPSPRNADAREAHFFGELSLLSAFQPLRSVNSTANRSATFGLMWGIVKHQKLDDTTNEMALSPPKNPHSSAILKGVGTNKSIARTRNIWPTSNSWIEYLTSIVLEGFQTQL